MSLLVMFFLLLVIWLASKEDRNKRTEAYTSKSNIRDAPVYKLNKLSPLYTLSEGVLKDLQAQIKSGKLRALPPIDKQPIRLIKSNGHIISVTRIQSDENRGYLDIQILTLQGDQINSEVCLSCDLETNQPIYAGLLSACLMSIEVE